MVEYPKPGENDPVSNAQRRCHFDNQSVEEYRLSLRRLNVAIAAETSQEKLAREREAKNYSDGFTYE